MGHKTDFNNKRIEKEAWEKIFMYNARTLLGNMVDNNPIKDY